MSDHYDIIIIGTGAGGGTLAHELAATGKRILIIERGGYLPREQENWSSEAVFADNRYKSHEIWHDGEGRPFQPGIHYFVGGNTKFYGAVLLRMRERDFGEVVHRDGISPAWPLDYRDFAPFYLRAEQLYQVHGQRGADPDRAGGAITLSVASRDARAAIMELAEDLRQAGRIPFPLPLGVLLDEARPQDSHCIRCNTCDGFPCLVHAKSDAQVICVDPALENPNVELMTHAFVERLDTNSTGTEVQGVVVRHHDGAVSTYRADVVVVACGAINSAALLLRSTSDRHPSGLGNRSDVIGRHYMFHNNSALVALSKRPNDTRFQKTLGLNDYYWGDADSSVPLGHIQMLGKTHGSMFKDQTHGLIPGRTLEDIARHSLDFWLTTEDLPLAENRVTVRADGLQIRYQNTNLESHRQLIGRLRGLLRHIGCDDHLIPRVAYFSQFLNVSGTGHQNGTIRFGTDPSISALNLECRSHEVHNLYVVDASFFPSSSAVNPTLTIIANAIRVADHLKSVL